MVDKKILILGASGFIGKHLVKALNKNEVEVFSFDKEYDITHPNIILNLLKEYKPEIVINLAANFNRNPEYFSESYKVNVEGTKNLLEMARRCQSVKRIILIGTNEEDNPSSPYGVSKKMASMMGKFYCNSSSYSVINLKMSIVYGPGQTNKMFIPSLMESCINKEMFKMSSGKQKRDFVYIDDAIQAIILACSNKVKGVINIGSGNSISLLNIVHKVGRLFRGIMFDNGVYPLRPGEPITVKTDINDAKAFLNWEPRISIDEGLKKTGEWWKNE